MSGTTNISSPLACGVVDASSRVLIVSLAVPALLAAQAPLASRTTSHWATARMRRSRRSRPGHYRAALARDSTNYAAL